MADQQFEKPFGKNIGIVHYANVDDLNARDEEIVETKRKKAQSGRREVVELASHIQKVWQVAYNAHKTATEPRLDNCRRRRRGEYSAAKLADIRARGGSEAFAPLTRTKCLAALSWLKEILASDGDIPFSLKPTPIPDLPGDVQAHVVSLAMQAFVQAQETGLIMNEQDVFQISADLADSAANSMLEQANRRAKRMQTKIEDQLVEAGFTASFYDFLDDVVTYPSAILKGPVRRMKPRLTWQQSAAGQWDAVVEQDSVDEIERISPWDFMPSPNAKNVFDGPICERLHLSRYGLQCMKGVEGYSDADIDAVLVEAQGDGLSGWLDGKDELPPTSDPGAAPDETSGDGRDDSVQGIEFHGSVSGQMLHDWGMKVDSMVDEYDITAIKIGEHVIYAVINDDPLRRRPYYVATYDRDPDSIWGTALPERMATSQDNCNSAWRHLVNNLAIASGPQVAINDINRIPPGEDITAMEPWKIWQFIDPMGGMSGQPPIQFFNPPINVEPLLAVVSQCKKDADDETGIPPYTYGSDKAAGAGRTASGLAMLMNSASKGIKAVIGNIDLDVIRPLVMRFYTRNMLESDDNSIKGDLIVTAHGKLADLVKEQVEVRRQEFLQLALQSEKVMQIIGDDGLAELLREMVDGLQMNTDKIVPNETMLRQQEASLQLQMQNAQQLQAGGDSGQIPSDGSPRAEGAVTQATVFAPPNVRPQNALEQVAVR